MNRFSLARIIRCSLFLLVLCATLSLSAGRAGAALSGDCDQSGSVSLAEVQSSINMFLGTKAVNACVDTDLSGTVTLAEVKRTFDDYIGMLPAAMQVSGAVKDATKSDAIAVSTTTVKVYLSGATTPLKTVITPSSGAFSVTGLNSGQAYTFVFSKTGYMDTTYYNVTPTHVQATDLGNVRMLPDTLASQEAVVNGYITRAEDNSIFPYYARLEFRAGVGNTTGAVLVSKSTDVDGYYLKALPAGIYTATVVDTSGGDPAYWKTLGSFTVYAVPGVNVLNNSQNYAVPTGLGTARYRAVLSWGNAPYDLDFHLTGPVAPDDFGTTIGDPPQPRFHLEPTQVSYLYGSATTDLPNRPGTLTEAYLDFDYADHGNDNGSETLTILTQRTGTYKFYVFKNSTDTQPLGTSGAQVKLYKGAQLVQTFNVPVASGNTWHVFNLDGDTVTAVNAVSTTTTTSLQKRVPGATFDETTLFKQIVKVPRVRTP